MSGFEFWFGPKTRSIVAASRFGVHAALEADFGLAKSNREGSRELQVLEES